ncbi:MULTISPECIES: hypothetical protein [Phyllobacteriaceae]|mgnify:CR=1 FL=1|jgi:hypothetical protein|uniref:DoxX family protein n=1 Tax=Mesorhizobium hungaricum TaxID=1566387 RepID=A0A1C2DK17_9HYPH|nr:MULTISPECIES: hypothetical protein [Mesorhizobium]MBN9233427.1 hypothetical protein [Mesorhizobium sp.]MCE7699812.1 hypothetical protein [Methanobacterium paludis]MDQ0331883.1 hypothetical protein [Mesorhizobium sp. YL-MeA3-2017]OCX15003.1 hypothetical protein QV13_21660 [Mesorhizobium hungaricum]
MRTLLILIGLYQGANGLFMLAAPALWYVTIPGVTATGPANPHFIRDIGLAFIAAAAGLIIGALKRDRWMLIVASIFLGGHALLHLAEMQHGTTFADALRDIALIVLPGLLPLAAIPAFDPQKRTA